MDWRRTLRCYFSYFFIFIDKMFSGIMTGEFSIDRRTQSEFSLCVQYFCILRNVYLITVPGAARAGFHSFVIYQMEIFYCTFNLLILN